MFDGTLTDTDLTRYQHPDDPGCLITSSKEAFIAAVQHNDIHCAIFERKTDPVLQREIAELAKTIVEHTALTPVIVDGKPQIDDAVLTNLTVLRKELQNMLDIYRTITEIPELKILVLRDIRTDIHPHDFPVLNTVWDTAPDPDERAEIGTTWADNEGELHHAPLCALFFLKAQRLHAGYRRNPNRTGVTIIVQPSNDFVNKNYPNQPLEAFS